LTFSFFCANIQSQSRKGDKMYQLKIQECKTDSEIINIHNVVRLDFYNKKIDNKSYEKILSEIQERISQMAKERK